MKKVNQDPFSNGTEEISKENKKQNNIRPMNRETIYRGKRCSLKYKGQEPWVYGYLVESTDSWKGRKPHKSWIISRPYSNGGWFSLSNRTAVQDETVGQYTGLKDSKGQRIFEGDIFDIGGLLRGEIAWHPDGYWCIKDDYEHIGDKSHRPLGEMIDYTIQRSYKYEVVGNVHEQNYQL